MDASAETGTQVWWTGKHVTKVLIPHELVPSSLDKLLDLVEINGVRQGNLWFSNRTGTSVDDDARKSNNWLDQWESSKLSTGSRVQSFARTFLSSTDVSVLLLNQPNKERQQISSNFFQYTTSFCRFYLPCYSMDTGVLLSFLSLLFLLSVIILVVIIHHQSSFIVITLNPEQFLTGYYSSSKKVAVFCTLNSLLHFFFPSSFHG